MGWLGLGALWALASGLPALADDTELFIGNSLSSTAQPNILFILDNSGSMGSLVLTQNTFDAATTYPSMGCDPSRVYWRTGTGNPPGCGTSNYFDLAALRCQYAANAFTTSGFYTDNMAQYDPTTGSGGRRWETISATQKTRVVECQDDRGYHGGGGSSLYAKNGATTAGDWGDASTEIAWGSSPANAIYTLYSGNYLNWYYGPTAFRTRLEIVQDVATALLNSVNGVNVGLMYFNRNVSTGFDDGGRVGYAVEDIATARGPMQTTIQNLVPDGNTPLSETLAEAARYYSGRNVVYGDPNRSVAASREPGNPSLYHSPIDYTCQKNFVVLLTDGEPTRDDHADTAIRAMTDHGGGSFASHVGASCDAEVYPAGFNPSGGTCLDDLAELLYDGDWSPLAGRQNVTTYTVGFTIDLPILAEAAQRGGGRYYTADDTATLASALTSIVTTILSQDTTFTAPTVAVNSYNRTQNLSDLFVSVFKPSGRVHWPGNLKKYRIRASDAEIVDAAGAPAVDPVTGFFHTTARSYWSAGVDGQDVEAGGAANLIPDPTVRQVYTYLNNDPDLPGTANRIELANLALNDAVLNTGVSGEPTRDDVINFINGWDIPDYDQDGNRNEPRAQMGDPLHAQPVSVVYGPGLRQGLIFFATNDGFLHAVDLETGIERWSFLPPEFLANQVELFKDESAASKNYGIDSDLRLQITANNDGVIDHVNGEQVFLFFGMGRGGDVYYALDVSNPLDPQVKWRSTLPGAGQSWSAPMPTKMNIGGTERRVLVIGGGYEADQDNSGLTTDTTGNSIYIVDSDTGSLLWRGTRTGGTANFAVSGRAMDYSFPGRVRIIDIDGDGLTDRMYAGDMGGQVWRFDVHNGQPAASLVTGGVIAQLGGAPSASPAPQDVRRFYNAPDVAFINTRDGNFIHVGIGSGHRGHPLSTTVNDRFYALRDYAISPMSQAQFDTRPIITDGALAAVTTTSTSVGWGAPGWRLDLNIGGWNGEKVLAEARTFANQVFFSTFQPSLAATTCEPQIGRNRTYAMSVYNGAPVMNLDSSADPTTLTMTDLYVQADGGILSAAQALFVERDNNANGIPDSEEDTDGDGLSDANDDDDDGNGTADEQEDLDGDGVPNYMDDDDDGDGMTDDVDNAPRRANANEDPDGDGIPNALDDDDDGDGVLDVDDDNDDVVCVALRCFSGVMSNDPIRTLWSQESTD
jgi:type IV pilus assembly protein PilY1